MIYIMTEDQENCFGVEVWNLIIDGFQLQGGVRVLPCCGKDNIKSVLDGILPNTTTPSERFPNVRLTTEDTVIISLDGFANNAYDNRDKLFDVTTEQNVQTYISRYGSIEAVLLSFKRFFSWVHFRNGDYPVDVSVYLNALKLFWIRCRNERLFPRDDESIEDFQESSYFQELDRNVGLYYPIEPGNSYDPFHGCDWLIKPYYDAIQGPDRKNQIRNSPTTAEQATSRLLESLTFNSGFKSKKGDLGKCWNNDCCHDANRNSEGKIFPGSSLKACNSSWISDDELMTAISDITVIPGKTPFEKLQWVHTRNEELREGLYPGGWTSQDKALMLLFESDFARGFSDANGNIYSLAEILGINSPDANQLPPPEPLPETEPQWNQQQATSPAWNTYQQPTPPQEPQPPQSSTRGGMRSQARMQAFAPNSPSGPIATQYSGVEEWGHLMFAESKSNQNGSTSLFASGIPKPSLKIIQYKNGNQVTLQENQEFQIVNNGIIQTGRFNSRGQLELSINGNWKEDSSISRIHLNEYPVRLPPRQNPPNQ